MPVRRSPATLLISFEECGDVGGGNAKRLESFSDVSAAVARDDFPAGRTWMQDNGHVAFARVGGAKRPIVRDRGMQGVPNFPVTTLRTCLTSAGSPKSVARRDVVNAKSSRATAERRSIFMIATVRPKQRLSNPHERSRVR